MFEFKSKFWLFPADELIAADCWRRLCSAGRKPHQRCFRGRGWAAKNLMENNRKADVSEAHWSAHKQAAYQELWHKECSNSDWKFFSCERLGLENTDINRKVFFYPWGDKEQFLLKVELLWRHPLVCWYSCCSLEIGFTVSAYLSFRFLLTPYSGVWVVLEMRIIIYSSK